MVGRQARRQLDMLPGKAPGLLQPADRRRRRDGGFVDLEQMIRIVYLRLELEAPFGPGQGLVEP